MLKNAYQLERKNMGTSKDCQWSKTNNQELKQQKLTHHKLNHIIVKSVWLFVCFGCGIGFRMRGCVEIEFSIRE